MNRDHDNVPPAADAGARNAGRAKPIVVSPGKTVQVLRATLAGNVRCHTICVSSSQSESQDDGGSQSPLGYIDFGTEGRTVRAEFDVREGTILNVPASTISVSVLNRNEPGDSDLAVCAFRAEGGARGLNTRSFDIDDEQPNIRVPNFATTLVYQLAVPDANYRALVSDSETGETYGQIPEGVLYTLHHRARWIRFFDVQTQVGGVVTFFLSI